MTKETFLSQLGSALSGNMDSGKVNENLRYYSEYISGEVQGGKTEEEVLQMLGDPWILARTLIDADNGTDRETVYEAGGTYENQSAGRNRNGDAGGTSYGGRTGERKMVEETAASPVCYHDRAACLCDHQRSDPYFCTICTSDIACDSCDTDIERKTAIR